MGSWRTHQQNAFKHIKRKNWKRALEHLQSALKKCGDHPGCTSRLFYWMGVVLGSLDERDAALRSWRISLRISSNPMARSMVRSFSNEYGMPRQHRPALDDWRAFFAIQMERYLGRRHGRFGSSAERDMVCELIAQEWFDLKERVDLTLLSGEQKKSLFRTYKIVFPLFPLSLDFEGTEIISFDFRRQVPLAPDDPCSCGSGLPFSHCCGRVMWPQTL